MNFVPVSGARAKLVIIVHHPFAPIFFYQYNNIITLASKHRVHNDSHKDQNKSIKLNLKRKKIN